MRKTIVIILFLIYSPLFAQQNIANFEKEITRLQLHYKVENITVLVKKGEQYLYQKKALNQDTLLFPVASLTKIFASVLVMQLVENQQLSLDNSIIKFLPDTKLTTNIQVKHLLSHTSQGEVGKAFYYSNSRYTLLTQVIEKASGKKFETLLNERILKPLKMQHTFLLKDSSEIKKWGNKMAKGKYEYGFSASGGLVSCIEDLALFDYGLDFNILLTQTSKDLIFTPFYKNSPYGLGIFTQNISSNQIIWCYGQASSFASLYVKVPQENLTYIVLADNNTMNNYPKLIYGDLTTSLFALSFLENFVSKLPPSKKILAEVLTEIGRGSAAEAQHQIKKMTYSKKISPVVVLYALFSLKIKLKTTEFDNKIKHLGKKIMKNEPQNPYLYFYLGNFYNLNGDSAKANQHFTILQTLPNFDRNWYTEESEHYFRSIKD
ncbi:MAG: serine hydrolase [Thermonemataceae bacterium]|nr:serine hydrolase [Thermonemataceae bacterium]